MMERWGRWHLAGYAVPYRTIAASNHAGGTFIEIEEQR